MGIPLFKLSGDESYPRREQEKLPPTVLTNLRNVVIERHMSIGGYLVVELRYLDCDHFEGRKILVYKNQGIDTIKELIRDKGLDPHFSETRIAPVARFVPTDEGWDMAFDFCRMMVHK